MDTPSNVATVEGPSAQVSAPLESHNIPMVASSVLPKVVNPNGFNPFVKKHTMKKAHPACVCMCGLCVLSKPRVKKVANTTRAKKAKRPAKFRTSTKRGVSKSKTSKAKVIK